MALRVWASSMGNALRVSRSAAAPLQPGFIFSRYFSSVIDGLKYSPSHEWVKNEGGVATVGITDHAQDHLGEVVFIELPDAGRAAAKGGSFGSVESVKATSDVYSPVSGEIVEVNSQLSSSPGLINSSPYGDGWLIKVKLSDPSELDSLLGAAEYTKICDESH